MVIIFFSWQLRKRNQQFYEQWLIGEYKPGAFLNSGYSSRIESKLSLQCPK